MDMTGGPRVVGIWGSRGGRVPTEPSFLFVGRRQHHRLFTKSDTGLLIYLMTGGCDGLGN